MRLLPKVMMTAIAVVSLVSVTHAAIYQTTKITNVYSDPSGRVLIKWIGVPNPGPCGVNNGWVAIRPSANAAVKALAYTIYFSGKPARIGTESVTSTANCDGPREVVKELYSPGG